MSQREAPKKVPVTMRALIQRINRKFDRDFHGGSKAEFLVLKKTRPAWIAEFGDYHTIDVQRNQFMHSHVNPEKLGRELGVLQKWEEVRKD